MAMNKLERIEKDIEKTKGKIAELQKQLRELETAKTEQENLQIVQLAVSYTHLDVYKRQIQAPAYFQSFLQ